MLAVTTYATASYLYALPTQMPLLVAALRYAGATDVDWILASDKTPKAREVFKACAALLGNVVRCHHVECDLQDRAGQPGHNHTDASNLVIAGLQAAAWHRARLLGHDRVWSLEADILPQPKTLAILEDILRFDRGWYEVAMCTYPNAAFLGGHGAPNRAILPSVYEDEKEIPEALATKLQAARDAIAAVQRERREVPADMIKEVRDMEAAVDKCPAKGNVFELNAAGWRRRGWFEHAYPGIGVGAVVPTDWVGLGCTLLGSRAFHLADFTGYRGGGTQDLWLCSQIWLPNTVRMAVTSHALCSHVKRQEEGHVLLHAHHQIGGESHGHLRSNRQPWPPRPVT